MASYSRVPLTAEEHEVELHVPTNSVEPDEDTRVHTNEIAPMLSQAGIAVPTERDEDITIETSETTPMVDQANSTQAEIETETGNNSNNNNNNGRRRLSILAKLMSRITRKPNIAQPIPLTSSNDGVFSNLAAKPSRESEMEEESLPPYEIAAADAAPPYGETTIIAPGMNGDEILVEGLPVGNVFSFVWNMLVSMSFQFVGFLLTYLLHTNHAAKNGSRAGLGFTLVQYGFYLRGRALQEDGYGYYGEEDKEMFARSEWLSYLLMFLGWFIVIRSFSDYIRVKRLEAVMRTTPEENV